MKAPAVAQAVLVKNILLVQALIIFPPFCVLGILCISCGRNFSHHASRRAGRAHGEDTEYTKFLNIFIIFVGFGHFVVK
jgi:hypothetical protein